jgi:regulator of protease activity HflC (stomatin/prohibitin superfamily)
MSRYYDESSRNIKIARIAIDSVIALAVLIMLIAFWPLRTVPTGHRGVITVGGAIKGIEGEGFTLVAPWQQLSVFNVRAEQADVKNAEGATSDQQPVKTSMTVRYSVAPDQVAKVFEQFSKDGNLDTYIETATLEVFKAVTAKYTAPDLIAKRPLVSSDIRSLLTGKVAPYGAQIVNIDMTNFAFSAEYMQAINAKVTQDQLLQTAEKKALTVEAEQKQKVKIAEAEATALRAEADGKAYAVTKAAEAEANALRIQNSALSQNKDVLELRRIEVQLAQAKQWNGALPSAIYSGAPIPFMGGMGTNERPR